MAAISRCKHLWFTSCPFGFTSTVRLKGAGHNLMISFYSSSSNMDGTKMLFPGQGTQFVGMTTILGPLCPGAERTFQTAESVLGYDLRGLCLYGPDHALNKTVHCQPAVVVSSLAALEQLKANDDQVMKRCTAMAGFSVGEITALIASEAISLEQGLSLVKLRAELMQKACEEVPSAMISITGIKKKDIIDICSKAIKVTDGKASIANYIHPRTFVVSVSKSTLETIELLTEDGYTSRLNVSGGFHSQFMSSAVTQVREFLDCVSIGPPLCAVYSNVTGEPYPINDLARTKELLAEQIVKPVRWYQCMDHMITNYGTDSFMAFGPGRQLKTIMKRIDTAVFKQTTIVEV